MRISDWSSDVCSSDLATGRATPHRDPQAVQAHPAQAHGRPPAPAEAHGSTLHAGGATDPGRRWWRSASIRRFRPPPEAVCQACRLRKFPGTRSEEHTSELQSLMRISYAVFCLKKKKSTTTHQSYIT